MFESPTARPGRWSAAVPREPESALDRCARWPRGGEPDAFALPSYLRSVERCSQVPPPGATVPIGPLGRNVPIAPVGAPPPHWGTDSFSFNNENYLRVPGSPVRQWGGGAMATGAPTGGQWGSIATTWPQWASVASRGATAALGPTWPEMPGVRDTLRFARDRARVDRIRRNLEPMRTGAMATGRPTGAQWEPLRPTGALWDSADFFTPMRTADPLAPLGPLDTLAPLAPSGPRGATCVQRPGGAPCAHWPSTPSGPLDTLAPLGPEPDIDSLYDRVREQRRQLLLLKS